MFVFVEVTWQEGIRKQDLGELNEAGTDSPGISDGTPGTRESETEGSQLCLPAFHSLPLHIRGGIQLKGARSYFSVTSW